MNHSDPLSGFHSELEFGIKKSTTTGDVIVNAGDTPQDLEEERAALLDDGRDLRYATDAGQDEIAELRKHAAVVQVASDLLEHGLGLRLLPASYSPDQADRSHVTFWMERQEGTEVVNIGVTAGCDVGEVVVLAARPLAVVLGFPKANDGIDGEMKAEAALRLRFALRYSVHVGLDLPAEESLQQFGALVSRVSYGGELTYSQTTEYGVNLWVILNALPEEERAFPLSHFSRLAPGVAAVARAASTQYDEIDPFDAEAAVRIFPALVELLSQSEPRATQTPRPAPIRRRQGATHTRA
jgi:hypothetical protein